MRRRGRPDACRPAGRFAGDLAVKALSEAGGKSVLAAPGWSIGSRGRKLGFRLIREPFDRRRAHHGEEDLDID